MKRVLFIIRKGCGFCDLVRAKTKALAESQGFSFIEVDEKICGPFPLLFDIRLFPAVIIFTTGWPRAIIQTHNIEEYFKKLEEALGAQGS